MWTDKQEVSGDLPVTFVEILEVVLVVLKKVSEFLTEAFHNTWRVALNSNILNIVEKGGHGSDKSSDVAHIITQLLMRFSVNAIGIGHVDNTLGLSIFEQMK